MEGFLQGLEGYLNSAPIFAYIAVFLGGVLHQFYALRVSDDPDNGSLYRRTKRGIQTAWTSFDLLCIGNGGNVFSAWRLCRFDR